MKNKNILVLLGILVLTLMSLNVFSASHSFLSVSPSNNSLGLPTNHDITLSATINSTVFGENSTYNATIWQLSSPTGTRTVLATYTNQANLSTITATIPSTSLHHSTTYYWQVYVVSSANSLNQTNSSVYQFSTRTTGLDTNFIGLADFGSEIGNFFGNMIGPVAQVLLILVIIVGIGLLITAIVVAVKSKIENR